MSPTTISSDPPGTIQLVPRWIATTIVGVVAKSSRMSLTRSPLNAAIDGEGFFVIQGPEGGEYFTRRGDFRLDAQGQLVLPNGMAVMGQGGALTVPAGATAELRNDGTLMTPNGAVGRLRIVRFENPSALSKQGASLIAAGPEAGLQDREAARIAVGFVEESNVNLGAEMVALLQATRAFEAAMKSIRMNSELTESMIEILS